MHVRATAFLSRFPQRVSLALSHTLPASQFRSLYIFARTPHTDHAKVLAGDDADGADLKDAVIAKLRLDIAPNRVRLLREVEGGMPVLLESLKKLADQSVLEGSRVLVEVMEPAAAAAAAPTALPVPLTFVEERLGGEPMMVASLPLVPSVPVSVPFYLTPLEHYQLVRFLQEAPSTSPQMLMITGPVKSGKSRIVHDVLPRMLAAQYAAAPTTTPRPVIFRHTFVLGAAEEDAADNLVDSLIECALNEGMALRRPKGKATTFMHTVANLVAQGVNQKGGVLWLLFDELGAPIVASTPAGASTFTQSLKTMVDLCSVNARIVGTGSGMVALLTAIRAALPNGFVLWDCIKHVSLGREPSAPAALAMAEGIVASYATKWPPAVAHAVTPQVVLAQLACSAHDQFTSPRPALVACLATLMDDARDVGSPEQLLAAAVRALLRKLREESVRDTAVALERMNVRQRMALFAMAKVGLLPDAHDEATAAFVARLCEASSPPRLLPPYGMLLRSWVASDGSLSISSGGTRLAESVLLNMAALLAFHKHISVASRLAASKAALDMLASNGVGVEQLDTPGRALRVRAPCTVEELSSVPAVMAIMRALDREAKVRGLSASPSSAQLSKALRTPPGSAARTELMGSAGLVIIMWMRHVEAHRFFIAEELQRTGLSSAVVMEVVQAAVGVIAQDSSLEFVLDDMGVLTMP